MSSMLGDVDSRWTLHGIHLDFQSNLAGPPAQKKGKWSMWVRVKSSEKINLAKNQKKTMGNM